MFISSLSKNSILIYARVNKTCKLFTLYQYSFMRSINRPDFLLISVNQYFLLQTIFIVKKMNLADVQRLKSKCQYIQSVIAELDFNFNRISQTQAYRQIKLNSEQQKALNKIAERANQEIQYLIQDERKYEKQCMFINTSYEQYAIRKENLQNEIDQIKQSIQARKFQAKRNSKKFLQIEILQQQIMKEKKLNNKQMKHYNQILNQISQVQQAIARLQRKQDYLETSKIIMEDYEQENKQNYLMQKKYQHLFKEKQKSCSQIGCIDKSYRLLTLKKISELQMYEKKALEIEQQHSSINDKVQGQNKLIQQISKREKLAGKSQLSKQRLKTQIHQIAKPINFTPQPSNINTQQNVAKKALQKSNLIKNRKKLSLIKRNGAIKRNSLYPQIQNLFDNPTQKQLSKQQRKTVNMILQKNNSKQKIKIKDDANVLPSVIAKGQRQKIVNNYQKGQDSSQSGIRFELPNKERKFKTQRNETPIYSSKNYNTIYKNNFSNSSQPRINFTAHSNQKKQILPLKMTIRDKHGNRHQKTATQSVLQSKSVSFKKKKRAQRVQTEGILNMYESFLDSEPKAQYVKKVNQALNQFKKIVQLSNPVHTAQEQERDSYKITSRTLSQKKKGKNSQKGVIFERQSCSSSSQEIRNQKMFTIRENQQQDKLNTIHQQVLKLY